jgi:pimeloyl-ACP methyl ester carboxylesterase
MKKTLLTLLKVALGFYIALCGLLYLFQEKLIFFPQKLAANYTFTFGQSFEEKHIETGDGTKLNALLFKADSAKGLIFYLHGNAGSLAGWGEVARFYTDLNYDVFMLDYRGYGKSQGEIKSQSQLFKDNQTAYNQLLQTYAENQIVVLGYSIGSGLAAKLAADNNPKLLILQAPYYSLTDMMKHNYAFVPTFLLKYKFETNNYLKNCKMPVVLFHGDKDNVIYHGSSLKLQTEFKPQDTLITLSQQGHNGMTDNEMYKKEMAKLLIN